MACSACGRSQMRKAAPPRTMYPLIFLFLLQFLLTFAQGQGHGGSVAPVDERKEFKVKEGQKIGTQVGIIPARAGLQYKFSDNPREFHLNPVTGRITTATVIDRESLEKDRFDLFVQSVPSARHLIEVRVLVLDINDNSPIFGQPSIHVQFSETDQPGQQVVLDTATDKDIGVNDVTTNYSIVSGNDEGKFRLLLVTETSKPLLYLENTALLDREEKSHYKLNISAQDGGSPPRFGYLEVNIDVTDFNDNRPVFDQSDYSTTVNETVPPGTSIIQVRATDRDTGTNGDITYAIINDDNKQFSVNPKTGVVTTQKKLDCYRSCEPGNINCKPKSCVVTVEAKDNGKPTPLTGRAYVTVSLLDENDHDPKISFNYVPRTAPFAAVDEGATENTVVAIISVSDKDDGMNGKASVYIAKGNEKKHFKSSKVSHLNFIRVAGKLDREKINKYNLTVIATDMGTPPRSSTAFLIIMVNDINDHEPEFQYPSYQAKLSELVPVGSFVAGITATDNDTGINAEITYTIVSGDDLGWFKINPNTGLVTTKKPLDRETKSDVILSIRAEDGGPKPYKSYTNLSIHIWDENDETPKFQHDTYNKTFVEGPLSPTGTEIIILNAVDNDQGRNGTVRYSLDPDVGRNYPGMFQLDPERGKITTLKELDRESTASYTLKLRASDQGSPSLTATATIFVTVSDINDNFPIFYPVTYYADVSENKPERSYVTQVHATDKDLGENATVHYIISSGAERKFAIDVRTGKISTTQKLDREQKAFYRLTVTAWDQGSTPKQAVHSATVEIMVTDIQDTPPEFSSPNGYSFYLEEDNGNKPASIGRLVGQVRATNRDAQGSITYAIAGGDKEGMFTINKDTGVITTAHAIDREHKAFYQLRVIANGGSVHGEASVNITVTDTNDNAPKFASSQLEASVVENWPVGHEVYHVQAMDPDAGTNATITYALLPQSSSIFKIQPDTGMIQLAQSLNQVSGSSFTIRVRASDGGNPKLSTSLTVNVVVRDVNDHTPTFKQSSYEVSVIESKDVNNRFYQVTATDGDTGLNGDIVYSIKKGNLGSKFGIFPDGVLYVAQRLDREDRDLYVLTVVAQDQGVEPRRSSVNVTVHILDANDNAPIFSNETYDMSVQEGLPANTVVGSVSAQDKDLGRNAEISYKIEGSQSDFKIHPKSGEISTLRVFDREYVVGAMKQDYISILVVANDNGVVQKRDKATVNIHIGDANDNPPKFSRHLYEPSLYENTDLNTQVVRVSAADVDMGLNGKVKYGISDGNKDGKFRINPNTGQITLVSHLDRETKDGYTLTVQASDLGNPQMNSTAKVKITILDNNDNVPVFSQSQMTFDVIETAQPGEFITQVSATDADFGNNALIQYSITGGNKGTTFHMDSNTGKLYLAAALDYEAKHRYILNITATDFGSPKLSATVLFFVNVLDFNDNPPHFTGVPVVSITEGVRIGTVITTVRARDPDSGINGELRYAIRMQDPPRNHFNIDPVMGIITTNADIDREFANHFELLIVATDQAMPVSMRKSAEKKVTVFVRDINDNPPKFVSMNAAAVPSGAQASTLVTTIKANDPDEGSNGTISYELSGSNRHLFTINANTGKLYVKSSLSRTTLAYTLSVIAKDKGVQQKSATFQFTVITRSSIENGPTFSQTNYSGQIYENENIGKSILTVSAKYASNPSARIEYYITKVASGNTEQPRYFKVDKTSGLISTAEVLDREKGFDKFQVELYAVDKSSGTPRTRSVQVEVTLEDRNDNPPMFQPDSYSVEVSEDVNTGKVITQVSAKDADQPGTATLTFSIGGGGDGKFHVDPSKGEVLVLKRLNREEKSSYALKIIASDGKQSSQTTVNIAVSDINDEKPQFTKPWYSFDIREDARKGTTVGRVAAVDRDTGKNAEITFSLVSTWGTDKFSLHSHTGVFTLTGPLDYEQAHHYILKVEARDSGRTPLSSTVTVYMNILDQNDNAPVFDPSSYNDEVWENATQGTSILTVTATDIDSGVNSRVSYAITGGDLQGQFTVHPTNGTILTAKPLDREKQAYYNLAVQATDQAAKPSQRLSSSAMVTIILKDVNDIPPKFVSPKKIVVMENTPIGTSVSTVVVRDEDEGRNGYRYVEYNLSPQSSNLFRLEGVGGILKVNGRLDREAVDEYNLTVTATDKGKPPKSSTMNLQVQIGDDNDNNPIFQPKMYSKTVEEDIKVGTSLLTVFASDNDIGLNAEIRYFIGAGDKNSRDFRVDSYSGEFSINQRLDYEREKTYKVQVIAQDLGEPPRSDTATVTIAVEDVNDNSPVFVDSPYKAYVRENAEDLPVHVIRLTARDDDSGSNARVAYSIQHGEKSLFRINSTTGEILATKKLNREQQSQYELVVVGVDSGYPRLTGTGTVTVLVQDVNDNPPVFQHSEYVGRIPEGQTPPHAVLQVTATDADQALNAKISYSLVENPGRKFHIDPATGHITTTVKLDREQQDVYKLVVKATDGGSIPKTSTASVVVTVDDLNDNEPQFVQRSYTAYMRDPTSAGEFILGVTAVDPDLGSNGDIQYSIFGSDSRSISNFDINPNTGVITSRKPLSNPGNEYRFHVRATDKGQNPQLDEGTVVLRFLPTGTTGFPTFGPSAKSFQLSESIGVGHIVSTLSATAPGGRQITYHLAGGNIDQCFMVTSTGQVKVIKTLNYERARSYSLWVEARDNSSPPRSSFLKLHIDVKDENDNPPVFEKPYYNSSVVEEASAPVQVAVVKARDADSGENGRISYRIVSGNVGNAFSVESATGRVRTVNRLDREVLDSYRLTLEAVDHGSPQKTASAIVDVIVTDKNDKPPVFTAHFNTRIPENAPVGTFVIKITSTDADVGSNSHHTYGITTNPGNKFTIDPKSGNVTVAAALDRETKDAYVLRVIANDGAFRAETPFIIDILDVNDNPPHFLQPSYKFGVTELQGKGHMIGGVSAVDQDAAGPNSDIYYMLKSSSKLFFLDASTGKIYARQSLVYREVSRDPLANQYKLSIVAIDRGERPLSSSTTVAIEVKPANRHAPVFTKMKYFAPVPENALIGYSVIQIEAQDTKDSGLNAKVDYSKAGGNSSNLFSINSQTGVIQVLSSLGALQAKTFILRVKAQDRGTPPQMAYKDVAIHVSAINSHAPIFGASSFEVTIKENQDVGSIVGKISATDADMGTNGLVSYYLTGGNPKRQFSVDESMGYIRIRKKLDFEEMPVYKLRITARDRGLLPRETSKIFTVRLQDVNDNPPLFNQTVYDASVKENSASGTSVFKAVAKDADTGDNAAVEYFLTGDTVAMDKFTIGRNSGIIRSQGNIDYEVKNEYSLALKALNPRTSYSGTTKVRIHVAGDNEFIPQFVQKDYSFMVSESAKVGFNLGRVTATDKDKGPDGVVHYYLVGDSNSKGFAIDYKTGVISIARQVDRESTSEIKLVVLAKNQGPIRGNDTDECHVRITINDANDAPVFNQSVYKGEILENSRSGIPVLQVFAHDNDLQSKYRQFHYRILGGNPAEAFSVNLKTGKIYTNGPLDREKIAVYNITVGAVDSGVPPKTGSASVIVKLKDTNDNGPYFVPKIPVGNATENKEPLSEVVINLNPYTRDPDLDPNRGPYTYQLVDHTREFEVGSTSGFVKARVQLDREHVKNGYHVRIKVTDNGWPQKRTSTLTLSVNVRDDNDSPSQPRPLTIIVFGHKGVFPGGQIANVGPLDPDVVGDKSCSISQGDRLVFSIPQACTLNAARVSGERNYSLNISGNDGRHAKVYSPTKVQFRRLDSDALTSSVVVRIANMTTKYFLHNSYNDFIKALRNYLSNGDSVILYSVYESGRYCDLLLAVRLQNGAYMSRNNLAGLLQVNQRFLENEAHVKLAMLSYTPCVSSPCQHGGECSHQMTLKNQMHIVDSESLVLTAPYVEAVVKCTCPQGYTGAFCETSVDQCGSTPCKHGATCRSGPDQTFTCECPPMWTGPNCEIDVNECKTLKPCQNGGSCSNYEGSYRCQCPHGFTGRNCEYSLNFCSSSPCKNSGKCLTQTSGYRCECGFGERGTHCEVTSRGFAPLSYMEYFTMAQVQNTIIVEISTVQQNALLLYNPGKRGETQENSEFIALEIVGSKVRFSFALGEGRSTRITVPKNVSDGQWHRIEASRVKKVGTLKVSSCPPGAAACSVCNQGDPSCFNTDSQGTFEELNLKNNALTVGGVKSMQTILENPGQVSTHDFVGCMRQIRVDNVDLFNTKTQSSNGTTEGCRRIAAGRCNPNPCGEHGHCVDEWSKYRCDCKDGYMGKRCSKEVKPFSFGNNAMVKYVQKESFRRDQLLSGGARKRRSTTPAGHSISLRFRTQEDGMLFYSESGDGHTLLHIAQGMVLYNSLRSGQKFALSQPQKNKLADFEWHDLKLDIAGSSVSLQIDTETRQQTFQDLPHDPLSLELQTMSLGGSTSKVIHQGNPVKGFSGCMEKFKIDNKEQPFSGSTGRFDVVPVGGVGEGCVAKPIAGGGLHVAIIVIIVFFAVLLVAIVVSFVVLRIRRQQKQKEAAGVAPKQNGSVISATNAPMLSKMANDSGQSHGDSGYTENGEVAEEAIIRQHIAEELASRMYNEREITDRLQSSRPDIIEPETTGGLPESGMENGGFCEEPPEHYDIENASSIAPSDLVDIVGHYKRYRQGGLPTSKYKSNPHPAGHHKHAHRHTPSPITALGKSRESPLTLNSRQSPLTLNSRQSPALLLGHRDSPSVLTMQSTPLVRQSPASMGSRQSPMPVSHVPSPLTVNNLARQSPLNHLSRTTSPVNHLSRQSPNIMNVRELSTSPVHGNPRSPRSTPINGLYPSNISNSSTSVSDRHMIPNGHGPGRPGSRPPSRASRPASRPNSKLKSPIDPMLMRNVQTPTRGLTMEEVDRLNARPKPSPVSTLDARSSSSDDPVRNDINRTDFTHSDLVNPNPLLEPPDSTSEDSSNDSFTCSEFEYDNNKDRVDFSSKMLFPKIVENRNENDNTDTSRTANGSDSNLEGSLSTLLNYSEDELPKHSNNKNPNGTFNWDYLLNWGPSFEKLVGVFSDIAQLPDANGQTKITTSREEYV